jgi:hypothetical protein
MREDISARAVGVTVVAGQPEVASHPVVRIEATCSRGHLNIVAWGGRASAAAIVFSIRTGWRCTGCGLPLEVMHGRYVSDAQGILRRRGALDDD